MKVACHFTVPQSVDPCLDAAMQDGLRIVDEIGGEINFLYPGKTVKRYYPRFLSGFQQLAKLKRIDKRVDIHHVFSNGFYPYPIYSLLKKPVIVSSVIGLSENTIKFSFFLDKVQWFVVSSLKDKHIMNELGYNNVSAVRPGIDLPKFVYSPPLQAKGNFVLLMGSAPWNEEQFQTKGVDCLIQLVKELPWLEVVFLWRGVLRYEMKKRIDLARVGNRIRIIDETVNVNDILSEVHAGVLLAQNQEVVKSYPHSILEALAAGKPVIVSDCLHAADYVKAEGVGVVVNGTLLADCINAVLTLRNDYSYYCNTASKVDLNIFSVETMIKAIKSIYRKQVVM